MKSKSFVKVIGTPLTIFTAVVVLPTGLFMKFATKSHTIEEIHGLVGIAMAVATVLHLAVNWRPFLNHFKRGSSYISLIPVIILVALNFMPESQRKGPPKLNPGIVFQQLETSNLSVVAQVFKKDIDEVVVRLKSKGIDIYDREVTIEALARENQKDPKDLLSLFLE